MDAVVGSGEEHKRYILRSAGDSMRPWLGEYFCNPLKYKYTYIMSIFYCFISLQSALGERDELIQIMSVVDKRRLFLV